MFVLIEDSSQTIKGKCTLTSLGSLWIPESEFIQLESKILSLRIKHNCWAEFKYTRIDTTHASVYDDLIELFISSSARLNIITQKDVNNLDLKTYHRNDAFTVKMKMIFNLIFYNFKTYKDNFCKNKLMYLLADDPYLERGQHRDLLLNKLGNPLTLPVKHATNCRSHTLGSLQLIDLLTGLLCAYTAYHYFPDESPLREEIKPLLRKLYRTKSIIPVTTGRPDYSTKINNWFHRPGIVWGSDSYFKRPFS